LAEGSLRIVVEDNGAAWTAEATGIGHGLSLHGTLMAVVGGSLAIERDLSATRAILSIPLRMPG
jgi:glucose-6-phosphate-specific signal transduction histidine kinase